MGKIDFDACMGGLNEIGRDHEESTWNHVDVSAKKVTASHQLTANHELQFTHQDVWSLNHSLQETSCVNSRVFVIICSNQTIPVWHAPQETPEEEDQALLRQRANLYSKVVMLQANKVGLATRLAGS